jgi:RNA polymerase sigma-70 factor (ECF subfamily)
MKRFQQFYTDNGDKLFGYLLRKSGNTHLAADLVQETFTRYLERYRNREESAALLFTIGRNLFYDHVRQQKNDSSLQDDIVQKTFADQEDSYIAREESKLMLTAIRLLDDDERDILNLVVTSGLKYREIADIRGCSVANIKIKVHRARKKLKQFMKENNHE